MNNRRLIAEYATELFHKGYSWIIHELPYCEWVSDIVASGPRRGILEVEIKHSWADYLADYHKTTGRRTRTLEDWGKSFKFRLKLNKYEYIKTRPNCWWRPTAFQYLAPLELAIRIASDPNIPHGFGVVGYEIKQNSDQQWYEFKTIKKTIKLFKQSSENRNAYKSAFTNRAKNLILQSYWDIMSGKY